jgi:Serine endopeptidase inhibitors
MKQNKKSPLFARFLEAQEISNKTEIAGGAGPTSVLKDRLTTLKYPSDNDENVTLKYPSDGDEGVSI